MRRYVSKHKYGGGWSNLCHVNSLTHPLAYLRTYFLYRKVHGNGHETDGRPRVFHSGTPTRLLTLILSLSLRLSLHLTLTLTLALTPNLRPALTLTLSRHLHEPRRSAALRLGRADDKVGPARGLECRAGQVSHVILPLGGDHTEKQQRCSLSR